MATSVYQASEDVVGGTFTEDHIVDRAWPLRKYSWRDGQKWHQVEDESLTLHTKMGQLMVIQKTTALESHQLLNYGQLRALLKGDTLLIFIKHQSSARKFRVRFASLEAVRDCVTFLRTYFPITDVAKPEEKVPIPLGEMYRRLSEKGSLESLPNPEPLPQGFPLDAAVRMCILDPSFPDLVARVQGSLARMGIK